MKRPLTGIAAAVTALTLAAGARAAVPTPLSFDNLGSFSGDATFSPDGSQLTYYKTDSTGTFQLMVANSDGSHAHSISSSQVTGGPAPSQDKDGGAWGTNGFIALTVLDKNAVYWSFRHSALGYFWLNNGVASSLWVTTPDGQHWYELRAAGTNGNLGILPQIAFSRDGRKIVWSECMQASSLRHPSGVWRMYTANFNVGANSVPSLSNITNITPPEPGLYEPGSFTPDDGSVIYTSDWANSTEAQIYEKNLTTGAVTNLTGDTVWNEHPTVLPDGRGFIYLHQNELWLAPLGGREPDAGVRLSYFNDVADSFWENAARQHPVIPTSNDVSPDGTKVVVTLESIWQFPTAWAVVMNLNAPLQ